jgi:prepilin-type processing-associated H-X9-DG protein
VRNGELRFDDSHHGEAFPPQFFCCPSNADRSLAFRFNSGVNPIISIRTQNNCLFAQKKINSLAQIEDGLSNTAALAERPASQKRSNHYRAIALDSTNDSFAEMRNNCRFAFESNWIYYSPVPSSWWTNSHYQVRYDHSFRPNSRDVDCVSVSIPGNLIDAETRFWISSRSFHRGGVNVAFFDGSTRFTNDVIDLNVWQAHGTHNSHDFTSE